MAFAAATAKVWPVTADWSNGVRESLVWATDTLRSSASLVSSHRSYRIGPRRSFVFDLTAWTQEHRAIDAMIAGHRGSWLLPIWPDVQWLLAPVSAAAVEILCNTAGFDFAAGGRALLYRAVNTWEVVAIDSVEPDRIVLSAPALAAYGRGDRLYPLRRAFLRDGVESTMTTANASRRRISFDVAEPCDWPALTGLTQYLDHPVLEERPDESDDPLASFAGQQETVDFGAAIPVISDLPGFALRSQRDQWRLGGRAQHTWFRSLLYTLRGRQRPIWVPSWQADLAPVAAIAGGSTALTVEWAGYTLFGLGKPNRSDLRIELRDGTVFYRRVTNALEVGNTETLTLDAPLDAGSISPGRIRQISIMALCTLASDSTEITHVTDADGVATAVTGWQGVVPHV